MRNEKVLKCLWKRPDRLIYDIDSAHTSTGYSFIWRIYGTAKSCMYMSFVCECDLVFIALVLRHWTILKILAVHFIIAIYSLFENKKPIVIQVTTSESIFIPSKSIWSSSKNTNYYSNAMIKSTKQMFHMNDRCYAFVLIEILFKNGTSRFLLNAVIYVD